MLNMAVLRVPNKQMLAVKFNFVIYTTEKIVRRQNWLLNQFQPADRRLLNLLSALFFHCRFITTVVVGQRQIVLTVLSGVNPQEITDTLANFVGEIYNEGTRPNIIQGQRIFIDGLDFDIPLDSEITIGESKIQPCVSKTPLTFTI